MPLYTYIPVEIKKLIKKLECFHVQGSSIEKKCETEGRLLCCLSPLDFQDTDTCIDAAISEDAVHAVQFHQFSEVALESFHLKIPYQESVHQYIRFLFSSAQVPALAI